LADSPAFLRVLSLRLLDRAFTASFSRSAKGFGAFACARFAGMLQESWSINSSIDDLCEWPRIPGQRPAELFRAASISTAQGRRDFMQKATG
jgi:hypothetical protein